MMTLALEAMAYYGKEYSLTIVGRDGDSYEVLLCLDRNLYDAF